MHVCDDMMSWYFGVVHQLWCVWNLFTSVLRFRGHIWGFRSDRRGTKRSFHSNHQPGKYPELFLLRSLLVALLVRISATIVFIQSQGTSGVVMCMDSRTHGLQTGQSVCFKEINGMTELNGTTHQITGKYKVNTLWRLGY